MIFNRDEVRVEFALGTRSKEVNKQLFDHLYSRREALEAEFGEPLLWRRLEEKKVSLVACAMPVDGWNRDNWPAMNTWLVDRVKKMDHVFDKEIPALRGLIKGQPSVESAAEAASV